MLLLLLALFALAFAVDCDSALLVALTHLHRKFKPMHAAPRQTQTTKRANLVDAWPAVMTPLLEADDEAADADAIAAAIGSLSSFADVLSSSDDLFSVLASYSKSTPTCNTAKKRTNEHNANVIKATSNLDWAQRR